MIRGMTACLPIIAFRKQEQGILRRSCLAGLARLVIPGFQRGTPYHQCIKWTAIKKRHSVSTTVLHKHMSTHQYGLQWQQINCERQNINFKKSEFNQRLIPKASNDPFHNCLKKKKQIGDDEENTWLPWKQQGFSHCPPPPPPYIKPHRINYSHRSGKLTKELIL